MKILFIIDSLKMGGKERQLIELLKGLMRNDSIVTELVVMNNFVYYNEIKNLNVKLNYLIRSSKRDIKVFYKLSKICKRFKPDIIHTWDSMAAVYALPIAKFFKIKIINGSFRNATPVTLFSLTWFSKFIFPFYDKIISNSKAGLKAKKISHRNSCFIYNGFDFNRVNNLKPIDQIKESLGIKNKKIVGMVASFTPKKDWTTFFECAKIILSKRDDVIFLAVGDGPLLEKMNLFVGKEIGGKIIFISNYQPVEEIINVFDVGVLTTDTEYHKEGISNSIMEYMALGKPVIATNCGGNNELIIDGTTGILINNNSHEKLSYNILKLIDSPDYSKKLGRSGKKRMEGYFNINKMTNEYSNHYKGLVENLNDSL